MYKARINYWVDIGLLMATLTTFLTGIIKFPGFLRFFELSPRHLPMDLLMQIHDWAGVSIGVLALVHLLLHWKWIVQMTKHLVHPRVLHRDASQDKK